MKTKGKKSDKLDKKKPAPSKKDAKPVVAEVTEVLAASTPATEEVVIAAPSSEPVAAPAPAVIERRIISSEERQRLISLAAYYRAQKAGFGKTNPVEDWLMAEREVDAMIATGDAN